MQFVDNINPNPLASRNAEDITLSGITASKVNITVAVLNGSNFSFVAEPYQHMLKIRLSDILCSLSLQPFGGLPNTANTENWEAPKTVSIAAAATGESSPTPWSRKAFEGGYDQSLHSALMGSYWWTWRDQRCRTFVDGKELLGALFLSQNVSIKVVATFTDGTTGTKTFTVPGASGSDNFVVFDVSYSRIAAQFSKTIVSYNVYRGNSQYPQVYEVSHLRPRRIFIFRNSLGLFDTVYAMGTITKGTERDVKTFIGEDRAENISDNDSRESISVNSGHIDSSGERTLWEEFVHSKDVWEYASGTFKKIVVDEFDMKMPEYKSASMTFKYHYSLRPSGNGYEKVEL